MSPFILTLVIWIATRPSIAGCPGYGSPVFHETIENLLTDGIIDRIDLPALTEKGQAWLSLILKTPYPEMVFIDPRTKEPVQS